MDWQLPERQRLLSLVLVIAVAGIVVAACSTIPQVTSPAVTPIASLPTNSWLTPDGITRAVAFRTSFGLRADESWIRFVANDPRGLANVTTFSIPMTDAEVVDLRARLADRETVLADLEQFRTAHVETWGGYYLDGDAIVVLLIDPTGTAEKELRAAVPPPLLVKQARWSLQELNDLSIRVSDDPWLQAHYHLQSAGADPEHNTVAIEVSSADPTVPATIGARFGLGEELTVTIDGTGVATLPKGTITGRAVDADGKPVVGLDIQLVADLPGIDAGEATVPATGDHGSFEIVNLPATGYQLRLVVGPDTANPQGASQGTQVGEARVEVKGGKTTFVTITVIWP